MTEIKKEDWEKHLKEVEALEKMARFNLTIYEGIIILCKKKIKEFG